MFLKISQISQENNCVDSLFNKVADLQTYTGSFLWNSQSFKNNFFYRTPPVAASDIILKL